MRRKILLPLLFIVLLGAAGVTATLLSGSGPELGLDLQGGVSVVLAPTEDVSGDQLDEALEIIRQRVDALGVAEPDISRQGDAIVVELPGVRNRDRAIELVGETAELRFRPVLEVLGPPAEGSGDEGSDEGGETTTTTTGAGAEGATTTTTAGESTTTTAGDEEALGLAPGESAAGGSGAGVAAGAQEDDGTTTTTAPTTTTTAPADQGDPTRLTPREEDEADATVTLADEDGIRYRLGPAQATGRIVKTAQAEIPQGSWIVGLEMRGGANGIDKFNEIAAECFNRT